MKIITLTLNPAFDVHCFAENFAPYHENLAKVTDREAGGKGVNISRALSAFGVDNLALTVLGDENGESFEKILSADGLNCRALWVKGRIRENITVHTNGADETRISFEGFCADGSLLERVKAMLLDEGIEGAYVTFTGRAPSGITMGEIKEFLSSLRKMGAKIVIDSRSFSLEELIEAKPYLIKPNEEEISAYFGREISDVTEAKSAALSLRERGIENVMISLGDRGAVLASESGVWSAVPPRIEALSTIGAGDSSIGGFLAAISQEKSEKDALALAVAFGTAACLTKGTRPPRPEDVARILPKVTVNEI